MKKQKDGFFGERAITLPEPIMREMNTDPLYAALHITHIGYFPHASNHFREREEPISQHIFIYCVEGSGWFSINEKRYNVRKNQYFIIPPFQPHAYGSSITHPWTIYWIHYSGLIAKRYSPDSEGPQNLLPETNSRINERIDLFEEMFQTLDFGYSKENLLYSTSILHHFMASLKYLRQFRGRRCIESELTDMIDMAIHFMKENLEKKITVPDIAKHVGYSSSHFVAIFNNRVGYSPIAYLNQLKMQRACQLLDLTDLKVYQISYKVGINDCYYFSRLFHKEIGITPLAYRKQKKG